MKILTLGCSYTSWKWPTWADYLSQLAGSEHQVVNCGQVGDSNFIITHKLSYLLKHYQWDKVLIMWSGGKRQSVLIDHDNQHSVADLQDCSQLDVWQKLYANTLNDQLYVNINELKPEFKNFFPAYGRTDHHTKSDHSILLGELMLQTAGIDCYNMFYFNHDHRRKDIVNNLGHVTDFRSFNWLDSYPETFPYDTEKIKSDIDNHPLPDKHFELAEKICGTLNLHKHNYNQTLAQAQHITSKISKIKETFRHSVTPETKLQLQLKFNTLISRIPGCRDLIRFNFK